jgi:hypothetical protein
MPKLFNNESNALLGSITAGDVQCLVDVLEEEDIADTDYFIDGNTVDILEGSGASAELISLLRKAIGTGEGVEVRWEE